MDIREYLRGHLAALVYVLAVTVYGVFCFLGYVQSPAIGHTKTGRGIHPSIVPLIGIGLSWNGFWGLINASGDTDRSIGQLKVAGGTVIIVIMHLFLIAVR
ncbi:MAG TPA: hypothetical protein VMU29_10505 [Smithella sp.]|nr:hypothetical protein [Smithella sp.]